ncbi:MAG: amidohydrolase family protein [Verrucomicrobia bacterium]|nr:amidohydrolase family protein [Verrucomicrobiota bacterium]
MPAHLRVTPANPMRWIVVGQLLDAKNRRVLKKAHLVYNQNRILHVGTEAPEAAILNGQKTPDLILPEYTVMPGLIEGHSHIFLEGAELAAEKRTDYQKQDPQTLYQKAETRLRTLARLGIIAMRDGGDKDQVGLRLSKVTAAKDCPPFTANVFSPGAGIYRQGRYGNFFGKPLEDHANIESCVQARIAEGADHIKIVPTGIINFVKGQVAAKPQFSVEEIQQFQQAAHAQHRHLMAHASGEVGVGYAIDGGVDTVEHGFFITEDQLRRMRDQDISWVLTFAPVQEQLDHADIMGWTGETLNHLKQILENHARSLQKAIGLGVNVLVGSDSGSCGVAHGTGLLYEMELLENAGMPTLEILCQVTHGNNKVLTNKQPYGSLETGFKPRFIVTKSNPLETVKNLSCERWVVFDGATESSATVSLENL